MLNITQQAEIVEAYNSGLSIKQVAAKLELGASRVYSVLQANAVVRRPHGRSTTARSAEIIQAYNSGLTLQAVADSFGMDASQVYGVLKYHGVPRRRKGPQTGPGDAQRAEHMVELYKSGKTLKEVGDLYGVSRERVRQLINKVDGRPEDRRLNFSEKVRDKRAQFNQAVTDAVQVGLTACEAAETLNMNAAWLSQAARRLGLEFRSPFEGSRAKDAEAARLYLAGAKISAIAKAIGEKYDTGVYRRLHRAGHPPSRQPTSGNFGARK